MADETSAFSGQGPSTDQPSKESWRNLPLRSDGWRPAGLDQTKAREDAALPEWRQQARRTSPAWQTGGQTGSALNALTNDRFLQAMYQQQEDAAKTGVNPMTRADYTGIAAYSGTVKDVNGVEREFKAGDVWIEGKHTPGSNVFEENDQADANAIMAPLLFGKDAGRLYEEAGGNQEYLAKKIQDKIVENAKTVTEYYQSLEQQKRKEEKLAGMGSGSNAAIIGTGAATTGATWATFGATAGTALFPGVGTAALGAGFGLAGTAFGAVSSWLNLDDIRDTYASASVKREQDDREGIPGAISDAFSWGGAIANNASVFSNLAVGGAGALQGGSIGDDVTAFEHAAARESGTNWLRGAAVVGGAADMATIFTGGGASQLLKGATKAEKAIGLTGKAIGQGTMYELGIASVAVSDIQDLIDGKTYNEQTGQMTDMTIGQQLATLGLIGINVAQGGMARGLQTGLQRGVTQAAAKTGLAGRVDDVVAKAVAKTPNSRITKRFEARRQADRKVMHGGRTYYLDKDGRVLTTRMNLGVLAPSELFQGFNAAGLAMSRKAVQSGATRADDFFRAAEQLAVPYRGATIMLNATAEGLEEGYEEALRSYVQGSGASAEDLLWAAAGGVLGGAAMTAPYAVMAKNQSAANWDVYERTATSAGVQLPLDRDAWMKLTSDQQYQKMRDLGNDPLVKAALAKMVENLAITEAGESYNLERAQRRAAILQEEQIRKTANPAVANTAKITVNPDPDAPGYHMLTGPTKMLDDYKAQLQIIRAAEGSPGKDENGRPLDGPLAAALQEIITRLDKEWTVLQRQYARETDEAVKKALIQTYVNRSNSLLQRAWDGRLGPEAQQAVGVLKRRYPQDNPGSMYLGLIQVTPEAVELTLNGEPVVTYMYPAYAIGAQSADFDGDFVTQAEFILDREKWLDRRTGAVQNLGTGGVDVIQTSWDTQSLVLALPDIARNGSRDELKSLRTYTGQLLSGIMALQARILKAAGQPTNDLPLPKEFLQEYLIRPLQGGVPSEKLYEEFWLALGNHGGLAQLQDFSRESLINFSLETHRLLTQFTASTHRLRSGMNTRLLFEADRAANRGETLTPKQQRRRGALASGPVVPQAPKVAHDPNKRNTASVESSAPVGDIFQEVSQADYMRARGYTKYNPLKEQVIESAFVKGPERELYMQDRYVNSDEVTSELEKTLDRDPVLYRTLHALKTLLEENNRDLDPSEAEWSLLELAFYRPGEKETGSKTFLQVALDTAVRSEAEKFPNPESEEAQTFVARYRRLDAQEALLAVFGHMDVALLVPTGAAARAGLHGTLDSIVSSYSRGSKEHRKFIDAQMEDMKKDWNTPWHDAGMYQKSRGNGPSALRILGQAIKSSAKMLSVAADGHVQSNYGVGREDVQIEKTLTTLQKQLLAYLHKAADRFTSALDARGLQYRGELTSGIVYALLDLDTGLASSLVDMAPPYAVAMLWTTDGRFSKGFYEFLTNKNPDQALKALWWEGLSAEIMRVSETQDRSADRLVQFLAALRHNGQDTEAYKMAVDILQNATSPREAVRQLNMLYPDRVPQLTWIRDEGYLNPSGATGGYSVATSSKEWRENLQKTRDLVLRLDQNMEEDHVRDENSRMFYAALASERSKDTDGKATKALQRRIEWLSQLKPMQGPRMQVQSLTATLFDRAGSADKGTHDSGMRPQGEFKAGAEPITRGVGDLQILAGETTYDEYTLYTHPEILLQAVSITLADGTEMQWPGLDRNTILEYWNDPLFRPLIDMVLDPAVYDTDVATGETLARKSISMTGTGKPEGLGGILKEIDLEDGETFTPHLHKTTSGRILAKNMADQGTERNEWHRWALLYVQALAGQEAVQLDQERAHDLSVEALDAAGFVAQIVASLTEDQFKLFQAELRSEFSGAPVLEKSERKKLEKLIDSGTGTSTERAVASHRLRQDRQARAVLEALKGRKAELIAQYGADQVNALFRRFQADALGASLAQTIHRAYVRQGPEGKTWTSNQKLRLQRKLEQYGNLESVMIGKERANLAAIRENLKDVPEDIVGSLPRESDWDALASALFNLEINELLSVGSERTNQALTRTKESITGDYGDLTDSTHSYLINRIIEDTGGMATAARKTVSSKHHQSITGSEAARLVKQRIFGKEGDRLKHYTRLTPERSLQALAADTTSAAGAAIGRAGVLSDQLWDIARATRYNWEYTGGPNDPDLQDPKTARTVTLSLEDLTGQEYDPVTKTWSTDIKRTRQLRTDADGRTFMVADLAGRVFTDVQVTYQDKDGNPVGPVSLQSLGGVGTFPLHHRFPKPDDANNPGNKVQWFHTEPELIAKQWASLVGPTGPLAGASNMQITASFFHPADAPARAANSYVYQGAHNIAAPAIVASPVAGAVAGDGSNRTEQRLALDSTKKNQPAIFNARLQDNLRAVRDNPPRLQDGTIDYRAMFSALVSRHMQTEQEFAGGDAPNKQIHVVETLYRVTTLIRMEWTDESGTHAHVFSLEEMMAMQATGEWPLQTPDALKNATDVVTTPAFMPLSHVQVYFTTLNADPETWDGSWNNAHLAKIFPGLVEPELYKQDNRAKLARTALSTMALGTPSTVSYTSTYKDMKDRKAQSELHQQQRVHALGVRASQPEQLKQLQAESFNLLDERTFIDTQASMLSQVRRDVNDAAQKAVTDARGQAVAARAAQAEMRDEISESSNIAWALAWTPSTTGVRIDLTIDQLLKPSKDNRVIGSAPGDTVVVDTLDMPGNLDEEARVELLVRTVERVVQAGYRVALSDGEGLGAMSIVRREMAQRGYSVGKTIALQDYTRYETADQRAIAARLSRERLINRQNKMLVYGLVDSGGLIEQAGIIVPSQNADANSTFFGSQTMAFGSYAGARLAKPSRNFAMDRQAVVVHEGLLREIEALEEYQARKKKGEAPATPLIDHLVSQGKKVKGSESVSDKKARADLIRSLKKLSLYDPSTLMPNVREGVDYKLEEGDIFYVVTDQGVIVARAGYEPISPSIEEADLSEQLAAKVVGSGDVTRGLASFGHTQQQGISFKSSNLVKLWPGTGTTVTADITESLSEAFTKILFNVLKLTTMVEPSTLPYELPENNSPFPAVYSDSESVDGKEYRAHRLGTLSGSSAILGHSFVESVMRTLGGMDQKTWDAHAATFSTDEGAITYQNMLIEAMDLIRREVRTGDGINDGLDTSPQAVADELALMAKDSTASGGIFSQLVGKKAAAKGLDLVHYQITAAIIKAATVPGASIQLLLHSNGLMNTSTTDTGLDILGRFFDSRTEENPVKDYLLRQQATRLENALPGYRLVSNGQEVETDVFYRGSKEKTVLRMTLSLGDGTVGSDDAPSLMSQAGARKTTQSLTRAQEAALFLMGQGSYAAIPLNREKILSRTEPPREAVALFANLEHAKTYDLPEMEPIAVTFLKQRMDTIRAEYTVPITFEDWTPKEKTDFEEARKAFAEEYLLGSESYVDHMIRMEKWRRHAKDSKHGDPQYGWVSPREAMEALRYMNAQIANGRFPMNNVRAGAMDARAVFLMAESAWEAIERARAAGKEARPGKDFFIPSNDMVVKVKNGRGTKTVKVILPDMPDIKTVTFDQLQQYYMDIALAELRNAKRDTTNEIEASALLQTYQPYFSELGGAPLIPTVAQDLRLWDPAREQFLASIDLKKIEQLLLDDTIPEEVKVEFFARMGYENTISPDYVDSVEKRELERQRVHRSRWDNEIRVISHDAGPVDFTRGTTVREAREYNKAVGFANIMVQLSLLQRVTNPVLIGVAPVETAIRASTGALADMMTGPTATRYTNIGRRSREAAETFLANGGVQEAFKELFDDSIFAAGGIQGKLNSTLRTVFRWQSWTRSNKAVARTMAQSIMRSVASAPMRYGGLSPESALTLWETDPKKFKEKHPDLWDKALTAASDAFGMRMPAGATILNKWLGKLSTSHPGIGATSDLLLRSPLAFSGYFMNVLTNMTGMQAPQALFDTGLALLMDRFDATRGMSRDILKSAQIEVDFSSMMMRSGITHAGLLILGMMAQGFLGGEDEWERKEELEDKGIITLWDIRKLENDWRDREMLFMEGTPLEWLSGWYSTGTDEDGETITPFQPAWYLKQFTSPFLGIARFMRSGNFRDVTDGFADAMGNMPLAGDMISSWSGMVQTNHMLAQRAAAEVSGETVTDADVARSYNWIIKAVMNYERLYMEWGFLNQLYVGLDEFQRDPFAMPDIDVDGTLNMDKTGNPMETRMQTQRRGETGEVYKTEESYQGFTAQMRAYAANRAGLATILSIYPGNSYYRTDMPISETKINKQEITTVEDAAAIILSLWDEEAGHEILTLEGAAAVTRSLHNGIVRPGMPALENIYLTVPQRKELEEYFTKELMDAGLKNGLTADEAERYTKTMFYGDPQSGISSLWETIWSQGKFDGAIPYEQTTTYQNLNTTNVIGPDGKYWATGLERGKGFNLGGLNPLQRYSGGGASLAPLANLPVDELLNSVDPAGNVNTGKRSQRRKDDSQMNIVPEDFMAKMDDIIDAIKKDYNGGTYSGRGGAGGGRTYANNSYLPYLNRMNSPYWDNIPTIFGDTVSVRRADIRRERFTSDRGRLLPWQ